MVYYIVRLQHHQITEEFGTIDCGDPYDHYIGDTDETTNLRFVIVSEKGLKELCDAFIPDDPFNFESVTVIHEFHYEAEVKRFVQCMKRVDIDEIG
jgi:hypothetical protein